MDSTTHPNQRVRVRQGSTTSVRRACLIAALALSVPMWSACATHPEPPAANWGDVTYAECPVCKSEGDLACVRVTIEPDTPRFEYQGVTYYFCSTQCRGDFERHPDRYLEH